MSGSRLNALYGYPSRMARDPEMNNPTRHRPGRAAGPVHRPGPAWYGADLSMMEDPAIYLLHRPSRLQLRLRRVARSAILIGLGVLTHPVAQGVMV